MIGYIMQGPAPMGQRCTIASSGRTESPRDVMDVNGRRREQMQRL
jgi:hypothetical protein